MAGMWAVETVIAMVVSSAVPLDFSWVVKLGAWRVVSSVVVTAFGSAALSAISMAARMVVLKAVVRADLKVV